MDVKKKIFLVGLVIFLLYLVFRREKEKSPLYPLILDYHKKPRVNYGGRVVISIGCDKNNISRINSTLVSILTQSHRVDEVCLNIPPSVNKEDLTDEVELCCVVFQSGIDYGSNQNISPTLFREKEADTIILPVDSGERFGKGYVAENVGDHLQHITTKNLVRVGEIN